MKQPKTYIHAIIDSHLLRGSLFGESIYGLYLVPCHDTVCVIECDRPTRFNKYGVVQVTHPLFGMWQASLKGNHRYGMARNSFSREQVITALIEKQGVFQIQPEYYQVYGVVALSDEEIQHLNYKRIIDALANKV